MTTFIECKRWKCEVQMAFWTNRRMAFIERKCNEAYDAVVKHSTRTVLQRVTDFGYYIMAHSNVVGFVDTLECKRTEYGAYAKYVFAYHCVMFTVSVRAYDDETDCRFCWTVDYNRVIFK